MILFNKANTSLQLSDEVLEEIRDFLKDTKQQLNKIISEPNSVNQKLAEVETLIVKVEEKCGTGDEQDYKSHESTRKQIT